MENSVNSNVVVSAVIATRNRPHLVPRAVRSVLDQTLQAIEVIVVVDGPDPSTIEALKTIQDSRLRIIELSENVKAAGARNAGVSIAKGEWIAFLDDDDEWLPEKLALQLAAARRSPHPWPIVISRFVAYTPKGAFDWPRRLPYPDEPVGDYLFIRRSFFQGDTAILTSTLFAPRALLAEIPFRDELGINKHEDYDWLLRAGAHPNVGLEAIPEAMSLWHEHSEDQQNRLSQVHQWKNSLAWIRTVRSLITPRAYSCFLFLHVGSSAALQSDRTGFLSILKEAITKGRPYPFDLLLYLAMWLVPQNARHSIRLLVSKFKKKGTNPATA